MSFTFSLVNATYAYSLYQGVTFSAVWQPDASIVIANTLHPSCPSRLVKAQASNNSPYPRTYAYGAVAFPIAAVAGAMFLMR